jgi:hypothetical protein
VVVLSDKISMRRLELLNEATPVFAVIDVGGTAEEIVDTGGCELK